MEACSVSGVCVVEADDLPEIQLAQLGVGPPMLELSIDAPPLVGTVACAGSA